MTSDYAQMPHRSPSVAEKRCFGCGLVKPTSEFYRHKKMRDGILGKCKPCFLACERKRRAVQREHRAAYERRRAQRPERKAAMRRYLKERRRRDPLKAKAWRDVSRALLTGRLKRKPCELCGATERVQAHHEDYSKPLAVEWLCFRCHREHRHGQKVG